MSLLALLPAAAIAAPADPPPRVSWETAARLRYERVDDDLFAHTASATTLRLRGAFRWQITDAWEAFVEGEAVGALGDDYNSTANRRTAYPTVADPQGVELNQAWLRWHRGANSAVVGRQRIVLDNQRWVGNVGWRQNEQTFDAISLQAAPLKDVVLRYSAVTRVHRVNGDNAIDRLARQRDLDGHLLNAAWTRGAQRLTGYGYLVEDRDVETASTATWGARYALAPSKERPWGVTAELAGQRDYADNPLDFAHTYWLVEPSVVAHGVTFKAGWEHLGGNGRHALQTPLATLHAFNGWADRFTTTPANGLEDRYVAAGGQFDKARSHGALEWQAAWHDYRSDIGGQHYGRELDASIGMPFSPTLKALVKVAAYDADAFSRDTRKTWLQLEWNPAPLAR
ncbi:alginate export family protein [Cognatilysobacter segetis]|uniref:alginate export family protein n=1 Tax=Cognatilysobacter segetis TaxID=2492394 RepID=UPI001EE4142B|nr:alginate export family protein [Lysobacter segetis]